jgi:RHS repeat-associated protein
MYPAPTYTYGHSVVSQRQLINNQWQVSFCGYDGLGSVRQLLDFSGAVTDRYTYDAFGNLIAASGNTPNEPLFAGEQLDTLTGFYYLRARYLSPFSGRFQTMDSFGGRNFDFTNRSRTYFYLAFSEFFRNPLRHAREKGKH